MLRKISVFGNMQILPFSAENGHMCCTPSMVSWLQPSSTFRGIMLHIGGVAKGEQLVVCDCCMSAAHMIISVQKTARR
jgi:hypothetical protein